MKKPESEENLNSEAEPEAAEKIEDTAGLKQALDEEKKKAEEYLANWQRAQADFVNYKRRNEEERLDFSRYANSQLILGLLPILDDLERALDAVPLEYNDNDWVEGVRMVESKFKSTLEGQGVKQITAVGEPFDPNFHEAMRQDKGEEGIVLEEFQKGYMMHDKLLRPTRVVVGNGEDETATKEEE